MQDLDEQMESYPDCKRKVQRAAKRISTTRAVLLYLKVVLRNEPVRSFVPLSKSRGANFVKIELTMEQKLDALLERQVTRVTVGDGR